MPHLIYILFSGLIVLVPQQNSRIKAYLVKEMQPPSNPMCIHQPYLLISGTATVKSGSACRRVMPNLLECDLKDTDVNLTTETGNVSLPPSSPAAVHLPGDTVEGGSTEWLVRMVDVEPEAAKVKPDLEKPTKLYESVFEFGWNAANTCVLAEDHPPGPLRKVVSVNFKDQAAGGRIVRTQAVAEKVMFTSSVSLTQPSLKLKKGGTDIEEIILDCSATCPTLKFSNNVEQDSCTEISHFEHYKAFSNNPAAKPITVERLSRESILTIIVTTGCAGDSGSSASLSGTASVVSSGDIGSLVQPKPSDRLLCPPVVMEQ